MPERTRAGSGASEEVQDSNAPEVHLIRGARKQNQRRGRTRTPRSSLPLPHPHRYPRHIPGGCSFCTLMRELGTLLRNTIALNLKNSKPLLFKRKSRRVDLHLDVLRKRTEQFEKGKIRPGLYTQKNMETPAAPSLP